ncbi:GtrA family protein [Crocinitomicaceae bacterium]|nr:GtrA family protein [Crocinitomicaceae bacterium]
MVKLIRQILDVFYPLVSKIFDKTTYYYAACGTGNLVLSWILFFMFFQFVFQKKIFYVEFINYSLSAYSLSSFVCFVISFSVGFLLMKYVVFTDSELKGRIQLFRYGVSGLTTWIAHWILLKSFIVLFAFFPSIANVVSSCIVVLISYLLQKRFTFK